MLLSARLELFEPSHALPHRAQLALLCLPLGELKRVIYEWWNGKVLMSANKVKSALRLTSFNYALH